MNVEASVKMGFGGRKVVTFYLPDQESREAVRVEVSSFTHNTHGYGSWDPVARVYVEYHQSIAVGDFQDWMIVADVELAAQFLGIEVPADLWYYTDRKELAPHPTQEELENIPF